MTAVVVRYTPKSEQADQNQRLVEAVFAELVAADPGGVRYATFRLADGSFLHIAEIEGEENPLNATAAFATFQDGIVERCEDGKGPNPQPATLVGNYRLFAD